MVDLPRETDVVVIGGGPVGLASAIALRQHGLEVVLADRALAPVAKACGEGLMPDGVAALHQLGVTLPPVGATFRGIKFIEGDLSAEAKFGTGEGQGVQRPQLHRALADRAASAGAVIRWRSFAQPLASNVVAIDGYSVRCRWIVGADGIHSALRHTLALEPQRPVVKRPGVRQHFRCTPWTDLVEVHWHQGGQAYVTPVASDMVCVALIGAQAAIRYSSVAEKFPQLAPRLSGAEPVDAVRGATSLTRTLRSVQVDNFALVGDASGSVDAITGEGMALGFRQALALASAIAAGDLRQYQVMHRRLMRKPVAMARLLMLMAGRSRLRHTALRLLKAQPWLFERLLALHVGDQPAHAPLQVIAAE